MFELIDGKGTLLRRAEVYFANHYNMETYNIRNRLIDKPYSGYPYLAAFYSCTSFNGTDSVGLVRCSRKMAKSLVYHKTNKCKFYSWWRVWNPKEYEHRMNEVTKGYRNAEVHKPSLTQKDFKNPFLLTYATFYRPNTKVYIHFFVLNMEEARGLIYFNKNRADDKKIIIDVLVDEDTLKVGHMVHKLIEAEKELMAIGGQKRERGVQYIKGNYVIEEGAHKLTCLACNGITVSMTMPPRKCSQCGRHVKPLMSKRIGGEAEDDIPF